MDRLAIVHPIVKQKINDLTGNRMERLSRMHHHFGANVFLAGPDVVPDDAIMITFSQWIVLKHNTRDR